jgi:hypothetical protein
MKHQDSGSMPLPWRAGWKPAIPIGVRVQAPLMNMVIMSLFRRPTKAAGSSS